MQSESRARPNPICASAGSARRANYTVVGDTVNLAARIEARATGGEILLSEAARRDLSDSLPVRPWQTVELRGSDRAHALFELVPPQAG